MINKNSVTFVDLYAQYSSIRAEVDDAISDTITNSSFIRGPQVDLFEKNFAEKQDLKLWFNGTPKCFCLKKPKL